MADDTVRARDMMVRKLHTVRPETAVYDAIRMLLDRRVSGAPVVDASGKLVGILSERDCIQSVMRAIDGLPPATVERVMSKDLITVEEDADFLSVAHVFLTKSVRRIPVVDEAGKLLGQISRRDLLKAAAEVFDEAPSREAAVLYLSALDRTRPAGVGSTSRRTPATMPRRFRR